LTVIHSITNTSNSERSPIILIIILRYSVLQQDAIIGKWLQLPQHHQNLNHLHLQLMTTPLVVVEHAVKSVNHAYELIVENVTFAKI